MFLQVNPLVLVRAGKPISNRNVCPSKTVSASSVGPGKPICGGNVPPSKPVSSISPGKPICGSNDVSLNDMLVLLFFIQVNQLLLVIFLQENPLVIVLFGTKYSRMDQVKFVEGSL